MIGAGYVGLVSAAGFAEFGNDVVCIDKSEEKLNQLRDRIIPFYEPGLEDLVRSNMEAGRLSFSSNVRDAWVADVIFLAVGTPQSSEGSADLSQLWGAIEELEATYVSEPNTRHHILVLKSTVPVGTGEEVGAFIRSKNRMMGKWCPVANNPEFLREGTAVEDFLRPDRVVVGISEYRDPASGGSNLATKHVMQRLYEPVSNVAPLLFMTSASAELSKYASNAMLATRISFMNEIANLAEKVGADAEDVRKAVGHDVRIGHRYLYPGPGFGGSCFTKDLNALAFTARKHGSPHTLAEATLQVNDRQKLVPVAKMKTLLGGISGKKIGIWGLAFKPLTDDIRDAPSLAVIDSLIEYGCRIVVHDPKAFKNVCAIYKARIDYATNKYEAATKVDGLILMTEWREYRSPDFMHLAELSPGLAVVDARNVWDEREAREAGIQYARIGRNPAIT